MSNKSLLLSIGLSLALATCVTLALRSVSTAAQALGNVISGHQLLAQNDE